MRCSLLFIFCVLFLLGISSFVKCGIVNGTISAAKGTMSAAKGAVKNVAGHAASLAGHVSTGAGKIAGHIAKDLESLGNKLQPTYPPSKRERRRVAKSAVPSIPGLPPGYWAPLNDDMV